MIYLVISLIIMVSRCSSNSGCFSAAKVIVLSVIIISIILVEHYSDDCSAGRFIIVEPF